MSHAVGKDSVVIPSVVYCVQSLIVCSLAVFKSANINKIVLHRSESHNDKCSNKRPFAITAMHE